MKQYEFYRANGLLKQSIEITPQEVIFNDKYKVKRSDIKAIYIEKIAGLRTRGGLFLSTTGLPSKGMYKEKSTFVFSKAMESDLEDFLDELDMKPIDYDEYILQEAGIQNESNLTQHLNNNLQNHPNKSEPPMSLLERARAESNYSTASGLNNLHYVVLQVTLKEKFIGTGSGNLTELETVINKQAKKGYRLHTITTASSASTGLLGGDRIQATLVFEKIV